MNAEATAENRPAWGNVSAEGQLALQTTYKYQSGIKVIVIFVVEVLVVLIGLAIEHMVEMLTWLYGWCLV